MKNERVVHREAVLDITQSVSGLVLGLFMWAHMFFVSSILFGEAAMLAVTRFFEGYYFFGKSYPLIVSCVAIVIIVLFVVHALTAMRKLPHHYRALSDYYQHAHRFKHSDTRLWLVQAITGFALFFLATPHLFVVLTRPESIGPIASSYRVWHESYWALYLVLLFCVELHGGIGLYRLLVKWVGLSERARARLKLAKWAITFFFLILGLFTLLAYIKIGQALPADHATLLNPEA